MAHRIGFPRRIESAILLVLLFVFALPVWADEFVSKGLVGYRPTQENLAARQAFREDQFGIFIHWGVYSELGRGEWVMNNEKMTVEQYREVAKKFNPTKYDAAEWVSLFKRAGANYVTITSKHHDGFAMWDSQVSEWDIVDATPYGKDILKALADECQRQGLKLYFYHSHLDWTHPDYFPRGRTGKHSGRPESGDFENYLRYMDSQLAEILDEKYGKVAGIWFDGWWDQQSRRLSKSKDAEKDIDPKNTQIDWRLDRTYGLIHRLRPACLIGSNHHIAPFPGEDFQMFERDLPGKNTAGFSEQSRIGNLPLESCDTINGSWGYNADDKKVKSTKELIHYLVRAAGQDANLLLNVGPRPDGTIQEEFVERLEEMGEWLRKNGETVYASAAGPLPTQDWGVSTKKGDTTYLHILSLPKPDDAGWIALSGTEEMNIRSVGLFGSSEAVEFRAPDSGIHQIRLPTESVEAIDTILVVE